MNIFIKYISSQLKRPRGIIGSIVSLAQNIINREQYSSVASLVNANSDSKILDIGFGNGHLIEKLYAKTHAHIYGIDLAKDAIKMAKQKNRKAVKAHRLHLRVGDCCQLPYKDNTFDAVTSINTIYFWSDTVKGLTEIRRTLKPGKSFYNVVYTKKKLNTFSFTEEGYKKFKVKEFIEFGKQAGFNDVAVKRFGSGEILVIVYTK